MASNGGPGIIEIPARVYPGMFDGELQVSISVQGEEINLIVSTDSVNLAAAPSEEGTEGTLKAEIVKKTAEGFLVHLPGEVQGASNRIRYAVAK